MTGCLGVPGDRGPRVAGSRYARGSRKEWNAGDAIVPADGGAGTGRAPAPRATRRHRALEAARVTAAPRWPTGHVGWAFSGVAEFEGRTTAFLAEGHARGERLVVVADDPRVDLWPRWLLDRGDLVVSSTAEVYGTVALVDAASTRATFESVLHEALDRGYSGIRVAADNTSRIVGPAALASWLAWEDEVERFIDANPVTGLCAFDRSRAEPDDLHAAMAAHRTTAPRGRFEGGGPSPNGHRA